MNEVQLTQQPIITYASAGWPGHPMQLCTSLFHCLLIVSHIPDRFLPLHFIHNDVIGRPPKRPAFRWDGLASQTTWGTQNAYGTFPPLPIIKWRNGSGRDLVYRARPLSRFRVTESNGQGKAKEGLAEVINIHCRLTNQIN